MWTDVRLLHAALVRAHVVAHPVFPLEALLADGAGVGLLVGVGQAVAVKVVNVSEGLPAGLAGVVLLHLVGGGTGVGVRGLLTSTQVVYQMSHVSTCDPKRNRSATAVRSRPHPFAHLLHGSQDHDSCLDGLRHGSHGYGCRGDGHRHCLQVLLAAELPGLGQGLGGDGWGGGGLGELEQRQGHRLLLHPGHSGRLLLLPGRSLLHPDARVDRLVPPQVVAVLELLVAGGADVGGPARLGDRFD